MRRRQARKVVYLMWAGKDVRRGTVDRATEWEFRRIMKEVKSGSGRGSAEACRRVREGLSS